MSAEFDPYYLWLGIPPAEQPPNHYRLLGLVMFESNRTVIEAAADRQMTFLRQYGNGPHGDASQRLLNEISQSLVDLLNPQKKVDYDARLKKQIDQEVAAERSAVPVAIEPASAPARPTPPPAIPKAAAPPPKPAPARKPRPVEKPSTSDDDYLDELVPRRATPPRTGGRSKQRGGSGGIPQWAYAAGIGLILLIGAIVLWPKSPAPRFGTAELRVTDKDATVALDGQPFERDRWNAPFTLATGQHEATLTQAGGAARSQRFWIVSGETTLVMLGAAAIGTAPIGSGLSDQSRSPGRAPGGNPAAGAPAPATLTKVATGVPTGLKEVWRKKIDDGIEATALKPDGSQVAAIVRDRLGAARTEIQLWDREKGERVKSRGLTGLAHPLMQFSPDGKLLYHLLRIDNRGTAAVWAWDSNSGDLLPLFDLEKLWSESRPNTFGSAAFTSDSGRIAFALTDITNNAGALPTELSLWDIATRKEVAHVPLELRSVGAMAFSPNGRVLAVACAEERSQTPARVELRDAATLSLLGSIPLVYPNDVISSLQFAGDSLCCGFLVKPEHGEGLVVDVERKQIVSRGGQVDWRDSGGKFAAIPGSQHVLMPTGLIGGARMIDLADASAKLANRGRLPGPRDLCRSLSASADGKSLVSGGSGGELILWTIERN